MKKLFEKVSPDHKYISWRELFKFMQVKFKILVFSNKKLKNNLSRVATLFGNLKKPGIWEILKKLENLEFLAIFTCLVVKFQFDTKSLRKIKLFSHHQNFFH